MPVFKKAYVSLEGHSSLIPNTHIVKQNIFRALTALGIEGELLPEVDGFDNLAKLLNQDALYILNDSLPFHLCERPKILLCRSSPWVQSDSDCNTIGRFTHEMIETEISEIIACIARNKPIELSTFAPARNYLLFSEYTPKNSDAMGRNGLAKFSWSLLKSKDIHLEFLPYLSEGIPYVNEMLLNALTVLQNDDIVILTNSDICLVEGCTGIIRCFMDTRGINECFTGRIEQESILPLSYRDLIGREQFVGMDIFAFRKGSKVAEELATIPLLMGREGWDAAWASKIKHRLPYNIAHHWPHPGEWHTEAAMNGNSFNAKQIRERFPGLDLLEFKEGVGYWSRY